MIVAEIIYNLSILAVLIVLSNFMDDRVDRNGVRGQLLQGLLFGAIALVAMIYPFTYAEGIIFDGRSVVLSIGTAFFGPLTGAVSILMAGAYRVHMGGDGVVMGLMTILFSFLIGLIFYHVKKRSPGGRMSTRQLLSMGVILHFLIVVFIYTLPAEHIQPAIQTVGATLLLVYPVVTLLGGKILSAHEDRRIQMEKLAESEERFRLLIDSSEDIIFTVNRNLVLSGVFGKWMEPLGTRAENYVGKTAVEIHGEELGRFQEEQFRKALAGEDVVYEWEDDIGSGLRYYQTKMSPMRNENGDIIGLVGIGRDITDTKKMQEQLSRSLKEKNILIAEIHHRVKNNMAIISSLLNLQSGYAEGEETRRLLQETETRVRTMALVHELVYEGDNFTDIAMHDLLQRLVNLLERSFQMPDKHIRTSLQSDDITMDMSSSIPLALLVNELVTNSWKHGFNGAREGLIRVSFLRKNGQFELRVHDNGSGVSQEQVEKLRRPSSFGYTIINGLVQQLKGTLDYDNSGEGLAVIIRF
ncbi:MAG: PAS domain S-box protein [Balneolaceae bacterium]|nr:MAG: PAS domain S-box protein [Balneolaceae bacterium]